MAHRDSSTPVGKPSSLIGRTIDGRYRVERVIGEGGFGTVYEVTHLRFSGRFAMKVLLPNALANPEAVRRFQREARAAASIGHKHIVQVTDMGEIQEGEPYIVLEYLRGHSLANELGAPRAVRPTFRPLPAARVLAIGAQCCDALAAAHAAGIVHRDLKPDNIFLVADPNGADFVKVLDFGISKFNEVAIGVGSAAPLTVEGQMIGTPHYMSPEQVQGLASTDERTDVFSMGVLLYQCLTGELPFDGKTLPALTLAIMMSEPPPPTALRPELPPAVDEIVLRALGKSADDRYQRMIEMGRALEAARRALEGRLSEPYDGPTALVSVNESSPDPAGAASDLRPPSRVSAPIGPVRTAVLPVDADVGPRPPSLLVQNRSIEAVPSAPAGPRRRAESVWELTERNSDVSGSPSSLAPTPQSWPRVSDPEPAEKPRPWGLIVAITIVALLSLGGALAISVWLALPDDVPIAESPVGARAPRIVPPARALAATPAAQSNGVADAPSGAQSPASPPPAPRSAPAAPSAHLSADVPTRRSSEHGRGVRTTVAERAPMPAPLAPARLAPAALDAPPSPDPPARRRLSIRSEWPVAIDVTLRCAGESISRRVPGQGSITVDLPTEACRLECGSTNVGNPPCPGRVGATSSAAVIGRGGVR